MGPQNWVLKIKIVWKMRGLSSVSVPCCLLCCKSVSFWFQMTQLRQTPGAEGTYWPTSLCSPVFLAVSQLVPKGSSDVIMALPVPHLSPFLPSIDWPHSLLWLINVFHELDKMAARILDSQVSLAAPVEVLTLSFSVHKPRPGSSLMGLA